MINQANSVSWAIQRLKGLYGIEIKRLRNKPQISVKVAGGTPTHFTLVREKNISEEMAFELSKDTSSQRLNAKILVTSRLTPRSRRYLQRAGISWLERETGRCHLVAPGFLVDVDLHTKYIRQPTPPDRGEKTGRGLLRDRSGLIAETLLEYPRGAPIVLAELARETGISRGLVSRILNRLTRAGILASTGRPPHKHWALKDPGSLLDRWTEEERSAPEQTTGLSLWARSFEELLRRLTDTLGRGPYAIAGLSAAESYTPTLTAVPTVDVWIPVETPPSEIAAQLQASIVEDGANLRLLQTRSDAPLQRARPMYRAKGQHRVWVVSPFRAYVESIRSGGRAPEVAAALRRSLHLPSD